MKSTHPWGLTSSTSETKMMIMGNKEVEERPLCIGGMEVDIVNEFRYLGCIMHLMVQVKVTSKSILLRLSKPLGC